MQGVTKNGVTKGATNLQSSHDLFGAGALVDVGAHADVQQIRHLLRAFFANAAHYSTKSPQYHPSVQSSSAETISR
jgi:hypothetical protein